MTKELTRPFDYKPTAEEVRAARMECGLTQKRAGALFGYTLSGWQKKEIPSEHSANRRTLSLGEYQLLRLLAEIKDKIDDDFSVSDLENYTLKPRKK